MYDSQHNELEEILKEILNPNKEIIDKITTERRERAFKFIEQYKHNSAVFVSKMVKIYKRKGFYPIAVAIKANNIFEIVSSQNDLENTMLYIGIEYEYIFL